MPREKKGLCLVARAIRSIGKKAIYEKYSIAVVLMFSFSLYARKIRLERCCFCSIARIYKMIGSVTERWCSFFKCFWVFFFHFAYGVSFFQESLRFIGVCSFIVKSSASFPMMMWPSRDFSFLCLEMNFFQWPDSFILKMISPFLAFTIFSFPRWN